MIRPWQLACALVLSATLASTLTTQPPPAAANTASARQAAVTIEAHEVLSGVAASGRPRRDKTRVAARLLPGTATLGETSGVAAEVTPRRAGRTLTFQVRQDGRWRSLDTRRTNKTGGAFVPVRPTLVGAATYRVVAAATQRERRASSKPVTLRTVSDRECRPRSQPIDPAATGEAICLAARLDRWQSSGLMGAGQQLNVSNSDYLAPLNGLSRLSVVGFDLHELALGETYDFARPPLRGLLDLAEDGAVLVASWHATNPVTGGPFTDRGGVDLADLLDPATPAYAAFWSDYEKTLALLRRFQDGDGDSSRRTAVVLRPLHEANGAFSWWGKPDPAIYRQVWQELQRRAWQSGVHNVLWAYSFNLHTAGVHDPARFVPDAVDLAGLDSYDPEEDRSVATDRLDLAGYDAVRRVLERRSPDPGAVRMALTEVGPHTSSDGQWNPAVITRTVRRERISPVWSMLWFDDTGYAQAGRKQIGSLAGGPAWLRGCFNGLCSTR